MPIAPQALLDACQLPQRWQGRQNFVVLDLDFGVGEHFLALWQAWLEDTLRCETLVVVALAAEPPGLDELVRVRRSTSTAPLARALIDHWPPRLAQWHPLRFEGARVRLMLRCGPCTAVAALREISMAADAIVIGGVSAGDGSRWLAKALGRAAAPGAILLAHRAEPALRRELVSAGFELEADVAHADEPTLTIGRHAPRFVPGLVPGLVPRVVRGSSGHSATGTAARSAAPTATRAPARPTQRVALVIGAGLAGAATAAALAGWGWTALVLDRHAEPAGAASGNPAGLYHGIVHGSDGLHARLFRAAALFAQRCYEPLIDSGAVPGGHGGLLRLHDGDPAAMRRLIEAQQLPPDFVQALDAAEASALAGLALPGPAWWYGGGGWLSPAALVRRWLSTPGVSFRGGMDVAAIQPGGPDGTGWKALDAHGRELAQAGVLVLAGAEGSPQLLSALGFDAGPLQRSRGQVSGWASGGPHPLRLPVAGDGYVLPLSPDGLLCGATSDVDDDHAGPRDADDGLNFDRLARLTHLVPPADPRHAIRRVGWRLQSADRLPLVGPVPAPAAAGLSPDRLRAVLRQPGLFVLTALGSRGITLAPLMGELIAAQITGTPWPMERALGDAVDPARWAVRAARRAG